MHKHGLMSLQGLAYLVMHSTVQIHQESPAKKEKTSGVMQTVIQEPMQRSVLHSVPSFGMMKERPTIAQPINVLEILVVTIPKTSGDHQPGSDVHMQDVLIKMV